MRPHTDSTPKNNRPKYPERFGNSFDVDVVFDDIERAGEAQLAD
jgi:hypothetical protein